MVGLFRRGRIGTTVRSGATSEVRDSRSERSPDLAVGTRSQFRAERGDFIWDDRGFAAAAGLCGADLLDFGTPTRWLVKQGSRLAAAIPLSAMRSPSSSRMKTVTDGCTTLSRTVGRNI